MSKVLITGAQSFIGRSFIKHSSYQDIDEICLIKNKVEDVDFSNYDIILHVAAIVHQTNKIDESIYYKVNYDLSVSVAKKAKKQGVAQFIFLSTIKVYGEFIPKQEPWTERSNCLPTDSYGKSKLSAEKALKKLSNDKFIISIIRPPLVYGNGVKANMLSLVKLIERVPILPFKNINNCRSITSLGNLVQLIDLVIQKKAEGIFIPMDPSPLSTSELVIIISKFLNKKVKLFKLPAFIVYMGKTIIPRIFERLFCSLELDNSLTKNTLNYIPRDTTEEGIKKMIFAYKEEKNKQK
jgi:UDP-glucose 4-epimerase